MSSARGLPNTLARGTPSGKRRWRGGRNTGTEATAPSNSRDTAHRSRMATQTGEASTKIHDIKLRPTHFLSIPLGHNSALKTRVAAFTDALLEADPAVVGLEESIIIEPARLHITLGVMHLENFSSRPSSPAHASSSTQESRPVQDVAPPPPKKTVADALALLERMRPLVLDALLEEETIKGEPQNRTLQVPLEVIGVLQPDKEQTAHVLWIGPGHSKRQSKLEIVAKMVNKAFRDEGFITETRPLKLHCTVINTSQRKGKGRTRIGFSTTGIYESEAFKMIVETRQASTSRENDGGSNTSTSRMEKVVNFGTWPVEEIQLCRMGSRDPLTGAYVSVGGIRI